MDYKARRGRLRELLRSASADAMLVTNPVNVRYLTGFTGCDSYALITTRDDSILSDPRYEQQIGEQCPKLSAHIRKPGERLLPFACDKLRELGVDRLVVESQFLSVADYDFLVEQRVAGELSKGGVAVEQLREIKDSDELLALRRAVSLAERVFGGLRAQLTTRHTERDVANWIEYQLRCLGADGCSFSPIVAVGPRAALPHATPGSSLIGDSPFVLVDWGAAFEGYRSDLTRVLVTGKLAAKFSKAYQVVLAAQTAAISALRPGVSVADIDRAAREVIASAGMSKRFSHALGHGIGLDIHEAPRVGQNLTPKKTTSNSSERVLQAGMVITIEPGVYFPEWGGIRIEDDVLITPTGCEVLSSLPRDVDANRVELLA